MKHSITTNIQATALQNSMVTTSATAATMRAVLQRGYGGPDMTEVGDTPVPVAGDGEVLIRVCASALNWADWLLLQGRPRLVRLFNGLLKPKKPVTGMDVAGVVHAVGKGVTRFNVGDEVFGEIRGAHAEYAVGREDRLALKPNNLTFEQAAALPLAGVTALQAMRDKAKIQPGHKVLINGASGGVGHFAVQIAKALGAEVTAVCSGRNADLVRSIGADHAVDYTQADFTQTDERYDAILDLVGTASISACKRVLTPTGIYIGSVGRMGWALKTMFSSLVPGSKRVVSLMAMPKVEDLVALADLAEAGKVTPVIDRYFTLAQVPEALEYLGQGRTRGKSVISV